MPEIFPALVHSLQINVFRSFNLFENTILNTPCLSIFSSRVTLDLSNTANSMVLSGKFGFYWVGETSAASILTYLLWTVLLNVSLFLCTAKTFVRCTISVTCPNIIKLFSIITFSMETFCQQFLTPFFISKTKISYFVLHLKIRWKTSHAYIALINNSIHSIITLSCRNQSGWDIT